MTEQAEKSVVLYRGPAERHAVLARQDNLPGTANAGGRDFSIVIGIAGLEIG